MERIRMGSTDVKGLPNNSLLIGVHSNGQSRDMRMLTACHAFGK